MYIFTSNLEAVRPQVSTGTKGLSEPFGVLKLATLIPACIVTVCAFLFRVRNATSSLTSCDCADVKCLSAKCLWEINTDRPKIA